MNKLMGFLELKEMELPSIPWKQYTGKEHLDDKYLWTIRSAVYRGNDLNLPRSVGKNAEESVKFANKLLYKMKDREIIIYYPYFIAKKSGTLEIKRDSVVIEAVKEDLWNLVTYSDREVTIIIDSNRKKVIGNDEFLSFEEQKELLKYIPEIRRLFKDDLLQGQSVLLEWSYANTCDEKKKVLGDEYLVFYEIRTIT